VPFLQPTMSHDNVYTSCKQFAVTTRPCHPRTSYLTKSPEWVMTQSLLVAPPMYGKVFMTPRESLSSVGELLRTAIRPPRFVHGLARLYRVPSMMPVGIAVTLQERHHVENAKAPKHCPFRRCYDKPSASCLGVDAERNSDGVHRKESRHESDWPGGSLCDHP